ncbi:hypothetical protein F4779DRAFT_588302 [Xylariaceae sp. FL0662B]|nr:hypothetical protein F4779DRAFT_588302 [Xylariaceae sp. FL0662B]
MRFSAAALIPATLGLVAAYPACTPATTSTPARVSTTTASKPASATLAAAETVTLQLEIDNDTFTSNTQCEVGGSVNINKELISATIAGAAEGVTCTASLGNGETVDFTDADLTQLAGGKKVLVEEIACRGA